MRRAIALLLALSLVFALAGCFGGKEEPTNTVAQPTTDSGNGSGTVVDAEQRLDVTPGTPATPATVSAEDDNDDVSSSPSSSDITYVALKSDSITLDGTGATIRGSVVTITSAGTYSISGALNDGQIVVKAGDDDTVKLVLNGADIASSTSAPVYVVSADKTVITLAAGTENYITDGNSYVFENVESDEPNAAVFSKDDLTINGGGSLTVKANYNNGIQSKDDLKVSGGSITVTAANDGIKGRDSIVIKDGNITVNAGGDGMQSNNDEDPERGYVSIEGGTLNITARADGIQAETSLIISGGKIKVSSGGGSGTIGSTVSGRNIWGGSPNSSSLSGSSKGLKAGVAITIEGGTLNIDSFDDSIHSNNSVTINGGSIILASGDDAIHSDSTLEINGGDVVITKCYEGLESAAITINGGNVHVVSRDDGINVGGGSGGFLMGGRPGQENLTASGANYLRIHGGYVVVDALGDGLDINGAVEMSGGVVLVNGPIANDNGALDHGGFKMTGGFLVAVGSSGMAQAPSTSSTQYSVMVNLSSQQPAKTMVHIETEDGHEVLTFGPTKAFQSIVVCSPELKNGSTYVVYVGGSSTGTATDGLYSGGEYTAGTQTASLTISSIVTSLGSTGFGFPGGRGGNMVPGGMRR